MTRLVIAAACVAALTFVARPASATFHVVSISEVMSGFGADPNVQYVEVRMDLGGQNIVHDTRLTAFNADGSVVTVLLLTPSDTLCSSPAGRRILYATSAFATATGMAPDFTIPPGIPAASGMICWGAPSGLFVPAPTWDASNPNNYIDCVAYGNYTGPTRNGTPPTVGSSGTPSSLPAGNGTLALARVSGSSTANGNNATDFALAVPGPCRNTNSSGMCMGLGQCAVLGSGCGNGNLDPGEDCDDGNTVSGDGCQSDCTFPLGDAEVKCRRGVIKSAQKFGQSYTKVLSKCEEAVLKGKIPGPCPDPKGAEKIAKAQTKNQGGVAKACFGLDPGDAGFGASCPGFESQCTDPIGDLAGVAQCTECIFTEAGNQLESMYGAFATGAATALKCQLKTGKAVNKFFQKKTKLLAKCEDAVLKGKIAGPCPDTEIALKIAKEEAKMVKNACKACGGADKLCDGTDDTSPGDIGITSCPALVVPNGGPDCGAITITTLQDVVDCLDCVAEFKADCTVAASAHPQTLPSECNAVP